MPAGTDTVSTGAGRKRDRDGGYLSLHLHKRYDPRYDESRILYSTLADRENDIGPTALNVHSMIQ